MGMPMMWADAATETPALGSTEVWEIFNYTEDAHPVHPHTVQFQVVNRQTFDTATGALVGRPRPPEPGETGLKDMVIAYPGEVTRIKAQFSSPGRFVWHCHILEHVASPRGVGGTGGWPRDAVRARASLPVLHAAERGASRSPGDSPAPQLRDPPVHPPAPDPPPGGQGDRTILK